MKGKDFEESSARCQDLELGSLATDYGFGQIAPEQKEAFERHLLECKSCRQNVTLAQDLREELRTGVRQGGVALGTPWLGRLGWAAVVALLVGSAMFVFGPGMLSPPNFVLEAAERNDAQLISRPWISQTVEIVVSRRQPLGTRQEGIWEVRDQWLDPVPDVLSWKVDSTDEEYEHFILEVSKLPEGDYSLIRMKQDEHGEESILEEYWFILR